VESKNPDRAKAENRLGENEMAQKNIQAQNAPQTASEAPVEENPAIRTNNDLFALVRATDGQSVQNKVAFMGDIRQKLAQVADEAKANGEQAAETEGLAASAATRLFIARVNGVVTGDELTGLLGDTFGYKPKQDGTPGKTPAGVGEAIRKRIVRAVQGHDFVNGADGGRFFETMDPDEVAPVISSIGRTKKNEKGETVSDGISVWDAYKKLGDIKSQSTVRLPFAFDAKKILGLTEALSEAGARGKLLSNPSLLKAYAGLADQLTLIRQVGDDELADVKAALGVSDENENENEPEAETETVEGEQMAA
jgi:hypothetical protein